MTESPSYIKALLQPTQQKSAGRKVWSIDLEQVWLPFFVATNTMGDTAIPLEALGAPLRLAYDKDGAVRFSASGRPIVKVATEIAASVRMVRENFVANLLAYASGVATECPDGYKAQIQASAEAGKPILEADKLALNNALLAKAEAVAEAVAEVRGEAEAELVTA